MRVYIYIYNYIYFLFVLFPCMSIYLLWSSWTFWTFWTNNVRQRYNYQGCFGCLFNKPLFLSFWCFKPSLYSRSFSRSDFSTCFYLFALKNLGLYLNSFFLFSYAPQFWNFGMLLLLYSVVSAYWYRCTGAITVKEGITWSITTNMWCRSSKLESDSINSSPTERKQ